MDPDCLYPDSGSIKFNDYGFNKTLKSKKKLFIFKFVPEPWRLATYLGSDLKNLHFYERHPKKFVG